MTLSLAPRLLGPLVEECLQTIQPLAEKNANVLRAAFPEHHPAFLGDATKLRQALFNLLSNACKFTEKGRVDLTVTASVRAGASWLRFEVKDSGIGMTPPQLERIFQEFTQAEEGTSKRFGGTGLGLTLSRRLCQLMGGDISVVSEPGKGSTFAIEIPAPVAAPRRPAHASPDTAIRRILVAVEDLSVPDAIAQRLHEAGFVLGASGPGDGPPAFFRGARPAPVLPGLAPPAPADGGLLGEVQRRPDWRELPCLVVASTALGAEEQMRLAEAGVVLVLDAASQPLETLLATVAAVLQTAAGKAPHA